MPGSNVSYHRQSCPGRIFEDLGVGFSIGCIGGSLYYFVKGLWNAPRRQRIMGGLTHVRNRAPFLGGSFAMWGGVFSSMDCLLIYYRQKDDPWNAVAAGFITGGVLAFRGGMSVAFKNAVMGGVILLLIEGVGTIINAVSMRRSYYMQEEMMKQEMDRQKRQITARNKAGGSNPWEVDYSKEIDQGQSSREGESIVDKAKSFSF